MILRIFGSKYGSCRRDDMIGVFEACVKAGIEIPAIVLTFFDVKDEATLKKKGPPAIIDASIDLLNAHNSSVAYREIGDHGIEIEDVFLGDDNVSILLIEERTP